MYPSIMMSGLILAGRLLSTQGGFPRKLLPPLAGLLFSPQDHNQKLSKPLQRRCFKGGGCSILEACRQKWHNHAAHPRALAVRGLQPLSKTPDPFVLLEEEGSLSPSGPGCIYVGGSHWQPLQPLQMSCAVPYVPLPCLPAFLLLLCCDLLPSPPEPGWCALLAPWPGSAALASSCLHQARGLEGGGLEGWLCLQRVGGTNTGEPKGEGRSPPSKPPGVPWALGQEAQAAPPLHCLEKFPRGAGKGGGIEIPPLEMARHRVTMSSF